MTKNQRQAIFAARFAHMADRGFDTGADNVVEAEARAQALDAEKDWDSLSDSARAAYVASARELGEGGAP